MKLTDRIVQLSKIGLEISPCQHLSEEQLTSTYLPVILRFDNGEGIEYIEKWNYPPGVASFESIIGHLEEDSVLYKILVAEVGEEEARKSFCYDSPASIKVERHIIRDFQAGKSYGITLPSRRYLRHPVDVVMEERRMVGKY